MSDVERCNDCGRLAFVGDTVTITASEYEALKKAAEAGRARKSLSTYRTISRSSIARKPDLADFIIECADTMTLEKVREACLAKFGSDTPSQSSIFRFVRDMRRGGSNR